MTEIVGQRDDLVIEREPEAVGERRLDHVGVAHDHHALIGEARAQGLHVGERPRLNLEHGLSAGRSRDAAGRIPKRPARVVAQLVEGLPGPRADVDLVHGLGDLDP